MDAFEAVVAALLQRQGYWTQTSVKVELTPRDKRTIQRPSSPRWELDVVGYRGASKELLVVECKSYLDSRGVACETFEGKNVKGQKRYKLFFEERLRRIVLGRLKRQFVQSGFCSRDSRVRFGLAAGKVYGSEDRLRSLFDRKHWHFIGPSEIRQQLRDLRDSGYENTVASIVAKLLVRDGEPLSTDI